MTQDEVLKNVRRNHNRQAAQRDRNLKSPVMERRVAQKLYDALVGLRAVVSLHGLPQSADDKFNRAHTKRVIRQVDDALQKAKAQQFHSARRVKV